MQPRMSHVVGRILSYKGPDESDRGFAIRIGEPPQNICNWKGGVTPSLGKVRQLCLRNDWDMFYVIDGRRRDEIGDDTQDPYVRGLRHSVDAILRTAREIESLADRLDETRAEPNGSEN